MGGEEVKGKKEQSLVVVGGVVEGESSLGLGGESALNRQIFKRRDLYVDIIICD